MRCGQQYGSRQCEAPEGHDGLHETADGVLWSTASSFEEEETVDRTPEPPRAVEGIAVRTWLIAMMAHAIRVRADKYSVQSVIREATALADAILDEVEEDESE